VATINALVVVYNKSLAESAALASMNAPGVCLFIADNSTEDCGNRAFAQARGYTYVDMGGNMGLSRAYNRVISSLDKNEDDLICLFDDDTTVDSRYFEALAAAAAAHTETALFAPVVTDGKGMLSPCVISGAICRRVKSPETLPEQGVSAINSGLAVRLRVFREYRYDEGQFLDYIDHAFIRDVAGYERKRIYIMKDVTLRQRFSGSGKQSRAAAMARYAIFKKDVGYFCGKYKISGLSRLLLLAKRRLRLILN
jgi:GT2 family glycosyltransferase